MVAVEKEILNLNKLNSKTEQDVAVHTSPHIKMLATAGANDGAEFHGSLTEKVSSALKTLYAQSLLWAMFVTRVEEHK